MNPLAAIHVGKKQLGLDDETYRGLLERVTGKRSAAELSETERTAVVAEMRRQGFTPASKPPRKGLDGPYAAKLQALWIAGWNLGVVRDRRDKALIAFVERQTKISHTRFLRFPEDAAKVIEALKGWLARKGGVRWGWTSGTDFLHHDGAKIAWAQWVILHPGATLYPDRMGFDEEVFRIVGDGYPGKPLGALKPADWRAVMNALGEQVRALADRKAAG